MHQGLQLEPHVNLKSSSKTCVVCLNPSPLLTTEGPYHDQAPALTSTRALEREDRGGFAQIRREGRKPRASHLQRRGGGGGGPEEDANSQRQYPPGSRRRASAGAEKAPAIAPSGGETRSRREEIGRNARSRRVKRKPFTKPVCTYGLNPKRNF